jgi:diacylglycerol kinase family enzyme
MTTAADGDFAPQHLYRHGAPWPLMGTGVPLGTVNVRARELGLPLDAADVLPGAPTQVWLDAQRQNP